ncbi:hypothetical protein CP556_08705 [Natrinema sp. CBA1119]|uniref:hypothetical protein n=1 Tax=Natrinema sp. CBA1119 TaxID=1608465 RepID=UPI000BF32790|nr:hypothetical protein [Natrinema sp. CBA1119]PGF16184.1 hypothetical protein CP556_08705 [Natrinema sp. CBA1119]
MLTTETYTLDDAIEELEDRMDTLEEDLEGLEEGTDDYSAIKARRNRVSYLERGVRWQRDEEDWGGDAEIELGSMTAGEEAIMHREAPDNAGRKEMRLWFVAASTVDAPYGSEDDDLSERFSELSGAHPAFVEWLEAKANGLGIPNESGNGSSTSSTETTTEESETSTDGPDSTTTSSSDSPMA